MAVLQAVASTREVFENIAVGKFHETQTLSSNFNAKSLTCLDPMESGDINDEEAIRNKELEIMELGEKYKKEKKAAELAQLIRDVRPFLAMISKAKAAKLVRGLVDLFLDMEAQTGTEVQLCKVNRRKAFSM